MSEDLMNMVYRHIRTKIDNEEFSKSLRILMGRNVILFEDLPVYKLQPNHSFAVMATGNNVVLKPVTQNQKPKKLDPGVRLYHYINDDNYDDIEFFGYDDGIGFEYHMDDHAAENVIHRKNYPEEWDMFSDKMPWEWIYKQFKILAIRCL